MENTIENASAEIRKKILNHGLYKNMESLGDLKIFMEYHVFAVWDFMSLLKSLQNNLTCTKTPWLPTGNPETRFLINEIVCGEESDIDPEGNRISHFELYLMAMKQCGANTKPIESVLKKLQMGIEIEKTIEEEDLPNEIKNFLKFTFSVVRSEKIHEQAAVFTYGREDLIPEMFINILKELESNFPNKLSLFRYYIERHIEIDGSHHSHLARQMTEQLCGTDTTKKEEAQFAVKESLNKRKELWDGILNKILESKSYSINTNCINR